MTKKSANKPLEKLRAAQSALHEVARLAECGETAFHADTLHQYAIAYCWVSAGSALKDYASIKGLSFSDETVKSAIHFRDRLAHQALGKLIADVVWKTSINDGPELLAVVEAFIANTDPRFH